MQRRIPVAVGAVFVAMAALAGMAVVDASDPVPTFELRQLAATNLGKEPVLDYAEDAAVWYAGMTDGDHPGNLWRAPDDRSAFVKQASPPTQGGADATVHRDGAGHMFWATLDGGLEVTVHQGGAWGSVTTFADGDRPWFGTSVGTTYLAYKYGPFMQQPKILLHKWDGSAWVEVNGPNNPVYTNAGMAHLAVGPGGRLHLLIKDLGNDQLKVASWLPGDPSWAFTPGFATQSDGGSGIPRLVLDDAENVYVVDGETVLGVHSIWLHPLRNGAWADPYRLGPATGSATKPGAVAGAAGKLGVMWFQSGVTLPPSAMPFNTPWDLRYAVFSGATGSPAKVAEALVQSEAHFGFMGAGGTDVGDFASTIERQGNPERRVALAWGCTTPSCPGPAAGGVETRPMFAVQTGGEGLT